MNYLTRFSTAVFLLPVFVTGSSTLVNANEKPATSYVQFSCEPNANFFSMNSLDYRVGDKSLPKDEGLFLNSVHKDKLEEAVLVTKCRVADRELTLDRVFLNMPDNSGNLCATLDWGVFQIRADNKLVSEFISGCSFDIHVFTNEFNLHVCKSDFNETSCETLPWQDVEKGDFSPIRIGLLGDWR